MGFKQCKSAPRYAVNECGMVMNLKTGKYVHPTRSKDGYMSFTELPWYRGRMVHRLVAEEFVPNPDNKECVAHKDGNNSNNYATNLEWVSRSEIQERNYAEGRNHGRHGLARKVGVNETGEVFDSVTDCARHFGVDPASVRAQLNGRSKTCKGHTFTYL